MSKAKEAAACEAVLSYMIKQNRPYSATDVFNNAGKDYGKTAVMKALESLAESGKLKEKAYGKQKVYVANQNQFPDVAEEEITKMDKRVVEMSENVKAKQDEVRKLELELRGLESAISTEDATRQIASLKEECKKLLERLTNLKENRVLITQEEKEKITSTRTKYLKEWRKRKRMATDIIDAILEGYPKTKKQLLEEVGVETDEDHKVKPPET